MKKLAGAVLAASLLWTPAGVQAETGTCVQPSPEDVKSMLTKAAIEKNVPVEIVKAIATKESNLTQCNKDGTPYMNANGDNGIGIMQITLSEEEYSKLGYDKDKVENNPAYNIEKGIEILIEKYKFDKSPKIEGMEDGKLSPILEHWYFAIRNYNGNSSDNSPEKGSDTYQNKVYNIVKENNLVETQPFPLESYNKYLDHKINPMKWPYGYTQSMGNLKIGDRVLTKKTDPIIDSKLRDAPNMSSKFTYVKENTLVEIVSNEKFEVSNPVSLFHFYKVKVNGQVKYISSSNLKPLRIETANPLSINSNRKEGYGRIKLLKNVSSYKLVSGKEQAYKTYTKGAALRVYGTNNGSYNVGGGVYVKHDPAATKLVMAVAVDSKNKFAGYASEDRLQTILMESGAVKNKQDGYKLFLGYVESAKPFTMYRSNGTALKTLDANTGYRVHEIKSDRYDIGGGYYVKKTGTSYSPVFGGN